MRFYKPNSASKAENAFSKQISKFENFFRDDSTMSKYYGKNISRPMEHSQLNPTPSINIQNDFENFEILHLKKSFSSIL